MLTIQINGKTYIQGPNSIWSMNAIVQSAIDCGGLVELSPEKSEDTLYGRSIVEQIRDHKEQSIITKLRASLENMSLEAGQNSFDGIPNSRNYYDGQEKAYLNCLTILNRLTSLEEEKETEEEKESICEANMPEDSPSRNSGDNETFAQDWQPEKGDIIEVSHDNKYWHKKAFKLKDKGCFVCHNDISPNHIDVWLYARPLPQQIREGIVPEFDYMKITDGENYHFATLAKQVECITIALQKHPLFNNQK